VSEIPKFHTINELNKKRIFFCFSAKDLRHGLDDSPRWVHIEQSRLYCNHAAETLRKVQVRDTWINGPNKSLIEIDLYLCAGHAATSHTDRGQAFPQTS